MTAAESFLLSSYVLVIVSALGFAVTLASVVDEWFDRRP
jgi:hypothetical protein